MLCKIRSKETLKALYDCLIEREFQVVDPIIETELEVEVSDENQAEFEMLVAVYIAYTLFVRVAKEKIEKSIIDDDMKDRLMHDTVLYFTDNPYWKGLTLILVSSYFERSNSINIDSFMIFNMKGYKSEIEKYIDSMLLSLDEEDDQEEKEVSIHDLYKEVRTKLKQMDLDTSHFKTVHLSQKGDSLIFTTEYGTVINESYFTTHLGDFLQLEVHGAIIQWEKDVMLLPSICMIFPVEKIVIHEVDEPVKDAIKFAKTIISSELSSAVFTDCGGCDECND